MSSSLNLRKVVRVTATSVAAGATLAFLFLGGPADAASAVYAFKAGRGYS